MRCKHFESCDTFCVYIRLCTMNASVVRLYDWIARMTIWYDDWMCTNTIGRLALVRSAFHRKTTPRRQRGYIYRSFRRSSVEIVECMIKYHQRRWQKEQPKSRSIVAYTVIFMRCILYKGTVNPRFLLISLQANSIVSYYHSFTTTLLGRVQDKPKPYIEAKILRGENNHVSSIY